MPRSLQVWAWIGWPDNATSAVCILAATSQAQVARAAGVKSPARLWNLGVTGNDEEIRQAMSSPGTIFWYPTSERNLRPPGQSPKWRRGWPRQR